MAIDRVPVWMEELEDEDVAFIRRFVLASGSIKQMAAEYGVTYPTVRLRLDRLIEKIRLGEAQEVDAYVGLVKRPWPWTAGWIMRRPAFSSTNTERQRMCDTWR